MRISLPSGTPAELAVPDGRPSRGLALAPDIGGLRPLFDDLCARLAAEHGWAVCAPGPVPRRPAGGPGQGLGPGRTPRDDEQVGDLVAAAEVLRTEVGVERVAVLGFCLGGMYALKSADARA